MSSNPYTIKFSPVERKKYDGFIEDSEFNNLAELIRESINVYISNPEVRNPVRGKTKLDEAMKGFDLFIDRKKKEESELIDLVKTNQENLEIIQNQVGLLMKKAGISIRERKKAKRQDTSMEDIFDD